MSLLYLAIESSESKNILRTVVVCVAVVAYVVVVSKVVVDHSVTSLMTVYG